MNPLRLLALATESQAAVCLQRNTPEGTTWLFPARDPGTLATLEADAWLIPDEDARSLAGLAPAHIPVFVHHMTGTLADFDAAPNIIRMNAWAGCWENGVLELSATDRARQLAEPVLQALGWPCEWVADIPGFLRPRVIAMLVNEACLALADGVSTMEEIDKAMKLGTNYPRGPFEWARQIGHERVYQLLQVLAETDKRYQPAPDMVNLLAGNI
jgi:3-hydroxybutyryl-CoA dehydrogenase